VLGKSVLTAYAGSRRQNYTPAAGFAAFSRFLAAAVADKLRSFRDCVEITPHTTRAGCTILPFRFMLCFINHPASLRLYSF
jgi:hypothetical protein